MTTWTPTEPMEIVACPCGHPACSSYLLSAHRSDGRFGKAMAERIQETYNACAHIPDPATAIPQAIEWIKGMNCTCGYVPETGEPRKCKRCHALAALGEPTK